MRFSIRPKRLAAVLIGTTVLAGAATGAVMATENTPPDLSVPAANGRATSIPNELASSFAFLRRSQEPSDVLAGAAAQGVGGGTAAHYGVNPSLARMAGTVEGSPIWLVPGSTGSCIVLAEGGSACAANELVSSQGIYMALIPVSGGHATVIGVIPDNAYVSAKHSDGTESVASQSGHAFSVSSAGGVSSFTIHTDAGTSVVQSMPSTAPPPVPSRSATETSSEEE